MTRLINVEVDRRDSCFGQVRARDGRETDKTDKTGRTVQIGTCLLCTLPGVSSKAARSG